MLIIVLNLKNNKNVVKLNKTFFYFSEYYNLKISKISPILGKISLFYRYHLPWLLVSILNFIYWKTNTHTRTRPRTHARIHSKLHREFSRTSLITTAVHSSIQLIVWKWMQLIERFYNILFPDKITRKTLKAEQDGNILLSAINWNRSFATCLNMRFKKNAQY